MLELLYVTSKEEGNSERGKVALHVFTPLSNWLTGASGRVRDAVGAH